MAANFEGAAVWHIERRRSLGCWLGGISDDATRFPHERIMLAVYLAAMARRLQPLPVGGLASPSDYPGRDDSGSSAGLSAPDTTSCCSTG